MTPKNLTLSVIGRSAVVLLAAGAGSAAHAGTLLSSPSATVTTTASNNFPTATPSSNSVTLPTTFTSVGSVDSVLQGANSAGTTEYLFTVTTLDNTLSPFSSLVFQIGTGTGANFVPLGLFGSPTQPRFAGDFAFPASIATSTHFGSTNQFPASLTFSGGSLAAGSSDRETFTLAVPDQGTVAGNPFTFPLRETPTAAPPTVPEASSVVSFGLLLAFGAGGLCLTARRRKVGAAK